MKETVKCPKCGGSGFIGAFTHIANGVCFCCDGDGTVEIDRAALIAKISDDTRKKADWIMASTPESYEGLSYSKLSKMDNFSCGGWGLSEAYPDLRSHFCEVGRSFFIAAQEEKLAAMTF